MIYLYFSVCGIYIRFRLGNFANIVWREEVAQPHHLCLKIDIIIDKITRYINFVLCEHRTCGMDTSKCLFSLCNMENPFSFCWNFANAVLCVCFVSFFHFSPGSWVFGEFMCKMYQFVHALSYTASIFILMIICMERYFAIIFPITCKQILTPLRVRVSIIITLQPILFW